MTYVCVSESCIDTLSFYIAKCQDFFSALSLLVGWLAKTPGCISINVVEKKGNRPRKSQFIFLGMRMMAKGVDPVKQKCSVQKPTPQ